MTRVLRQSVVIDSRVLSLTLKRLRRLLTIRLRSEDDECRFIYILAEGGDILKHEDFWLYAGACGGRKTIVRFLSAHRASLLTACPAEVLPGVLCVRGVQREFEDLLAVLIFSPVRWG